MLKRKTVTMREPGLSRDRGIATIAQAMRESSRTRRRLRWWVGGAAATAVAAAALLTMPRYLRQNRGVTTAHTAAACSNSPGACGAATANSVARIDVGHMDGRDIVPGGVMQANLDHPAHVSSLIRERACRSAATRCWRMTRARRTIGFRCRAAICRMEVVKVYQRPTVLVEYIRRRGGSARHGFRRNCVGRLQWLRAAHARGHRGGPG